MSKEKQEKQKMWGSGRNVDKSLVPSAKKWCSVQFAAAEHYPGAWDLANGVRGRNVIMENFLKSRLKAKGHWVDFFWKRWLLERGRKTRNWAITQAWRTREAFSDRGCNRNFARKTGRKRLFSYINKRKTISEKWILCGFGRKQTFTLRWNLVS